MDRGDVVKPGQLLVELSAPEMAARIAEAESRVHAAESDRIQAEAQLAAAQSTWDKLKKAAETPGVIAGNELILAEKQVDAARALVNARQQAVSAAESAVRAQKLVAGLPANHRALRRSGYRSPGTPRCVGRPRQRRRASGDPAGLAPQADRRRARAGHRRNRAGRQSRVQGARLPGAHLLRHRGARGPRSRPENPHHARGVGRPQSRWLALAGHVPQREVAHATGRVRRYSSPRPASSPRRNAPSSSAIAMARPSG